MAFNQTPGREKFPSTGNGIPDEFKTNNDPKTPVKTPAKTPVKTPMANPVAWSGLGLNPDTNEAFALPYEKSYHAPTAQNQRALITDGTNTTIKSATGKKPIAQLRGEFVSDSTFTMKARNKNADLYNAGISAGVNNNLVRVTPKKKPVKPAST